MTENEIRGTATFIRQLPREGLPVDARLFRVDPPMTDWNETTTFEYVVVSGSRVPELRQPETYLFGADEHGKILDWLELDGSFQGDVDHVKALNNAGYRVVISGQTAIIS